MAVIPISDSHIHFAAIGVVGHYILLQFGKDILCACSYLSRNCQRLRIQGNQSHFAGLIDDDVGISLYIRSIQGTFHLISTFLIQFYIAQIPCHTDTDLYAVFLGCQKLFRQAIKHFVHGSTNLNNDILDLFYRNNRRTGIQIYIVKFGSTTEHHNTNSSFTDSTGIDDAFCNNRVIKGNRIGITFGLYFVMMPCATICRYASVIKANIHDISDASAASGEFEDTEVLAHHVKVEDIAASGICRRICRPENKAQRLSIYVAGRHLQRQSRR